MKCLSREQGGDIIIILDGNLNLQKVQKEYYFTWRWMRKRENKSFAGGLWRCYDTIKFFYFKTSLEMR